MKTVRNRLAALLLGAVLVPLAAWAADTTISALPAGAALTGTEVLPMDQGAGTAKTTPAAINTYVTGRINATAAVSLTTGVTGTLPVANGGSGAATLTGVLKGNGTSPFTASAVNLTSEITGTLPVGNGGTGATTLTGVLKGNGTSAVTASAVDLTSEVTGTLPVANGGLNLTAASDDNLPVGNGTTWQSKALTSCSTASSAMTYNTSTNTFGCNTISAGTPGGSDTQVQFNDSSAFGGDADYVWNKTTNVLTVGGSATAGIIQGATGLSLTLRGATGSGAAGSGLTLAGGTGATNFGGGLVSISGGAAGATSGNGADVRINGGQASGTDDPGNVEIRTGSNASKSGDLIYANSSGDAMLLFSRTPDTSAYTTLNILGQYTLNSGNPGINLTMQAGGPAGGSGTAGNLVLASGESSTTDGSVSIRTGDSSTRITFQADGSWDLAGTTPGTSGQVLTSNGASSAPTWQTASGGTPGGSDTQVQFNDSSAFGGDADYTWNKTTNVLSVGSDATPGGITGPDGQTSVVTWLIRGGNGGSTANGQPLELRGGAGGATSGNGGPVNIKGGVTTTSGNGGAINILASAGVGTDKNGGAIQIASGNQTGAGVAGSIDILAASPSIASATGGALTLKSGSSTSASGTGGTLLIQGGTGGSGGGGGPVQIFSGPGNTSASDANLTLGTGSTNRILMTGGSSASTGVRFFGYGAGTITSDASGNLTAVSDERVKRDIQPYARSLVDIMKISPITFAYRKESKLDQSKRYAGFSAQNVEKAIPEAVGRGADGLRSLDDRALIAALVNSVKELNARVKELEAREAKRVVH